MHLVGFIVRIYRDARSPERQNVRQMSILEERNTIYICINDNNLLRIDSKMC